MKRFVLFVLAAILSACASQGERTWVHDEFSKETISNISLGKLIVNKAEGLFVTLHASFDEYDRGDNRNQKGSKEYFLNFSTYSESINKKCPRFDKSSRAIFLVQDKHYEFAIAEKSRIERGNFGILMGGCQEQNILVGPLSYDFLVDVVKQERVRFKLYGKNSSIEGRLIKEELLEIKNFLNFK